MDRQTDVSLSHSFAKIHRETSPEADGTEPLRGRPRTSFMSLSPEHGRKSPALLLVRGVSQRTFGVPTGVSELSC